MIATLYEKGRSTVAEHLKNIFADSELDENSTCRKFRQVGANGKEYNTNFYNLEAVIAVGFRTNSDKAIQFRRWAISILKDFSIKGYVIDKERLKNGTFLNEEYFDHLIEEIREIRASERRFYQKITDIYATAMDYTNTAITTETFFKIVQNKLHFAIHGKTYGHPTQSTMNKLKAKNISVFRTDENGTIVVTSDGKNITFNTKPGSYDYAGTSSNNNVNSGSSSTKSTPAPTVVPVPGKVQTPSNNSKIVFHTPTGKSYHYSKSCSTLSRSKTILSGT